MEKKIYKKIYLGMSGGVDSSVAAQLLIDDGYDVTGVFIQTWSPEYIECTWREDRLDAMRVAAQLGIAFITIDLEKEYKSAVIDYMLAEYRAGRTPNPDIMCNKEVKFGAFYKYVKRLDPKASLATGHYARVKSETSSVKSGISDDSSLCKAIDTSKDQVYFLSQIDKSILPDLIFPLGDMYKSEVREIARARGLHVSEKKDSQGLCMLGNISIKDFLQNEIGIQTKGEIRNSDDEIIGIHAGSILYTIGERIATDRNEVYYVTSKDVNTNVVYVASHSIQAAQLPVLNQFSIKSWNSTSGIEIKVNEIYQGQTRYHGPISNFKVLNIEALNKDILIAGDQNLLLSAGQTLVLYDGDTMLGGGIIL